MIKLIFPVLLAITLPLIASWFAYPQTHLPPEFGTFPPQYVADAPGFNLTVFQWQSMGSDSIDSQHCWRECSAFALPPQKPRPAARAASFASKQSVIA